VAVRAVIVLVVLVALVIALAASGWLGGRAEPGSRGRVPVSTTSP
jgi:hypothetical protein